MAGPERDSSVALAEAPKIVSVQALLDGMSKQRAATGPSGETK
jgi:hypothetical protein